ncbi:Metallo-beta-lactamase superfamily protein [Vibrio campbellii]|uniref:MBL fold metallo-hydrolase n=1 Tax=Vibrio campbellii TaxID=680 RepID=UPI000530F411|nr:MBL fold metallo-hydrolase [Vibrio campbellii]KGR32650.1 Metallo-beta-lactamase superfamily protein [Vibrio campbellii]
MKRFIMFPVSVGDSFYLYTQDKSILVDGGQAEKKLEPLILNKNISKIDYMLCTHADSDHIGGLIGVLASTSNRISVTQVWVPSFWAWVVSSLITDDVWEKLASDLNFYSSLEEFSESVKNEANSSGVDTEDIIDITADNLSKAKDALDLICYRVPFYGRCYNSKVKMLNKIIKTASSIVKLLIEANNRNCKIRWFEFSNNMPASGGEPMLKPVNSNEIVKVSKLKYSLFESISLSVANINSLVFRTPNENNEELSDVVFSADSDFCFNQTKPSLAESAIVTTAHHGSSEHQEFYTWLNLQKVVANVVRSDKREVKRPCADYIAQKMSNASYCTVCRLDHVKRKFTTKLGVDFTWNNGWNVASKKPGYGSSKCSCK